MTHKKMIYGGAAVFLLGLIIWAIVTVPETPSPDAPSGSRIMSYENNTIHEERDGRTVWTLTAKRVNVDIDTNDTTMQGIEGTFYSADGRTLALQADEGHMDSATRNIVLTGSIEATTSDGASLRAQELKWTSAEGVLTAEGDAEITRDDIRATGDRIASTDEFQRFTITGNARVEKGGAK